MTRTYISVCHDEKYNAQIFYDYESKAFFYSTEQQKNSGIVHFSGFVGIILYAYLKDVSFDIGLTRLATVLLTMMIAAIFGFVSIKLSMRSTKENVKENIQIVRPTKEELKEYIIKGRKQRKKMLKIVSFLFFLSMMGSGMQLIIPNSMLFFFLNIAIWAASIYATWVIRPIKKHQIYKQFENEIQSCRGD